MRIRRVTEGRFPCLVGFSFQTSTGTVEGLEVRFQVGFGGESGVERDKVFFSIYRVLKAGGGCCGRMGGSAGGRGGGRVGKKVGSRGGGGGAAGRRLEASTTADEM